mgnify:CR=1 FL=1
MIYVMLANGFEEVEALTVVDVLRRANFDVQTVSITHSFQVEGAHGVIVNADNIFTEVSLAESELVVLPGGTMKRCAPYLKSVRPKTLLLQLFVLRLLYWAS